MTDLPYTYTDSRGDSITVNPPHGIQIRETFNGKTHTATIYLPTGEDAVALARAVLAAAGDTGHEVVNIEDYARAWAAAIESAARSMRERVLAGVVDLLETHGTTDDLLNDVDRLRALPLLPAATEGVRTMRHCVLCASGDHQPSAHDDAPAPDMWARLKSEIPRIYGRERVEDLPHDSEYATALHDVLTAMKRIEHGSPLLADVDDPEPQDEVPRDTELIQQVRALVKRYGAPWVAYEAARQARH